MDCWFWNIDVESVDYFRQELESNRLRQGWGFSQKIDLRILQEKSKRGEPLDDEEQIVWDHCSLMVGDIREGDLIVVKQMPDPDSFSVVQVAGKYEFKLDENIGDYGHILPVRGHRIFHKHAKQVSAPFTNALNRHRHAIRITYKHAKTADHLFNTSDMDQARVPERFRAKIAKWKLSLTDKLKEQLERDLNPTRAERLVYTMLQQDGRDTIMNAGPNERGADVIASADLGYGLTSRLAIQVKMHWGEDNDLTGLDQLELAFTEHKVEAGLLVTFADSLGPDLEKKLKEMKRYHKVSVLYGVELRTRLLALVTDPEVTIDENWED